ncbi:phosphatase 2C-like domain-containing protein [Gautieria morchelliformis]|nr:phosphatase 2C-like domain-containing protein [Gautieria morchelliformis]
MLCHAPTAFRIHVSSSATLIHSRARYHDFIRAALPTGGFVRIPLTSQKVIGIAVSRGVRSYQEDGHSVCCLAIEPDELQTSLKQHHGIDWNPDTLGRDLAGQVVFVGIYDGHGGAVVSDHLHRELQGLFESVDKSQVPGVNGWVKSLGGYFKRYQGGVLRKWDSHDLPSSPPLDLESRATLAFLQADRDISKLKESSKQGSTASVALFHSLDSPSAPFFAAEQVALTVAHCGDTRILLCSTDGGRVHAMTEDHHAETRGEAARLRRLGGTGLITDSFGEARWMGALANTRGLGDKKFKPFGVTPEPEVRTKLLKGREWAYTVSVSDGITSVLSDDEIVDLARSASDPQQAASDIMSFAEELGSEDNATVIVVPLAGWGHIHGPDKTKELREYRRRQAIGTERQRRM